MPSDRCCVCRKKLGLLPLKCRCENIFCGQHITAEDHNCEFNYKKDQEEKLKKAMPVVENSKMEKI
jgi:hypothetical protein